jgi:hypothetical protein
MKKIDEYIKVGENRGFSCQPVIRLSDGTWQVEFAAAGSVVSETWDIEEPEQLFFTPDGALVFVGNAGEVEEIISASALIRVKRVLP